MDLESVLLFPAFTLLLPPTVGIVLDLPKAHEIIYANYGRQAIVPFFDNT